MTIRLQNMITFDRHYIDIVSSRGHELPYGIVSSKNGTQEPSVAASATLYSL